jgi:hypothetical protein
MVLGVCTFLAGGTNIKVTPVRNGYIAASYRWLQGSTRPRRTDALHNYEGRRSEAIAEESHVV